MKQIFPDLWQTMLEIPFGSVNTHAYLLHVENGNVLLYNTSHDDEIDAISDLGGIKYQCLSHRDETGTSLEIIRERFGSKLCCHALEAQAVTKSCVVDVAFSGGRQRHHGLDVIHTPGHTIGSVTYLYASPHGKTYLFTGDTLFRTHEEWQTFAISSAGGSSEALAGSLNTYRELNSDVVLWSASGGGEPAYAEPSEQEWDAILDDVIRKLRS